MMSGAYFTSKNDLLKWLNETFGANYAKVEQCCTAEYEYVQNFKILQDVFTKQNIQQNVDVDRLVKGKYQDNLEFLQWIKHLWDVKFNPSSGYDAVARRQQAMDASGQKAPPPAAIPAAASRKPAAAAAKPAVSRPSVGGPSSAAARAAPAAAAAATRSRVGSSAGVPAPAAGDSKAVAELNDKLGKMRLTVEGLEKERNFYFGKLREIELLCQTEEEVDSATKARILEILYQTDENAEFQAPEEPPAEEEAPPQEEETAY